VPHLLDRNGDIMKKILEMVKAEYVLCKTNVNDDSHLGENIYEDGRIQGKYDEARRMRSVVRKAIYSENETNGWILSSEQLPNNRFYENGEPIEYNVMISEAKVPTTLSIDNMGIWFDWKGRYYNIISLIECKFDVIAWQQMPESYVQPM